MASSWIVARPTKAGGRYRGRPRHRVVYRLGGAGSPHHYGGSFATKAEALERKKWIDGELAARRVPEITTTMTVTKADTLREVAERWKARQVHVTDSTRVLHRVALDRVLRTLGERQVNSITADDVQNLVTTLDEAGKKRETIRKSVKYLAAVLDHHGLEPNPCRDKRFPIRLPFEEAQEINPSTGAHVEAVYRLLATEGGSEPRGAAVPRCHGRPAPDGDRQGVQGRSRARFQPARPPAPQDLAPARTGALVGRDRQVRRSAQAVSDGRHLHARPVRRLRDRHRSARRSMKQFTPRAVRPKPRIRIRRSGQSPPGRCA